MRQGQTGKTGFKPANDPYPLDSSFGDLFRNGHGTAPAWITVVASPSATPFQPLQFQDIRINEDHRIARLDPVSRRQIAEVQVWTPHDLQELVRQYLQEPDSTRSRVGLSRRGSRAPLPAALPALAGSRLSGTWH